MAPSRVEGFKIRFWKNCHFGEISSEASCPSLLSLRQAVRVSIGLEPFAQQKLAQDLETCSWELAWPKAPGQAPAYL